MQRLVRKYLVTIILLLITSILIHYLEYASFDQPDMTQNTLANIPKAFGHWQGTDQPLDPMVYDILETDSIISRTYQSKGSIVHVSIVYYPETKVDFHAPEACLAGQGRQIHKTTTKIILNSDVSSEITVNQLIYETQTSDQLVYYFYKTGDFMGSSYIGLRFKLALNKFRHSRKSGSLIRFSTPIYYSNMSESAEILVAFIDEIMPYIRKYL